MADHSMLPGLSSLFSKSDETPVLHKVNKKTAGQKKDKSLVINLFQ